MSSQSSTFPPRDTTPVVLVGSGDVDSFALDDTQIAGGTRTPPPNTKRRPVSTPLSNKVAGSGPYSSAPPDKDQGLRLRLATETAGLFLGPVPCDWFLNTFLPLTSGTGGRSDTRGNFSTMSLRLSEVQMYKPFVRISLSCPSPVQLTCLQRSTQLTSLHPI
jgi:hypothetical protein